MGTTTVDRTAAFSKYTSAIDQLPEGAFLGSLLYFSISNADVHLVNAHRDLKNAGLSTDHMRDQLRPRDAFAKAARRIEKKFKPKDGIRAELLVRQVGDVNGEELFRFLILERSTVEAGVKKKINFDRVGELKFTKGRRENGEYVGHGVEVLRTTERTDPITGETVSTLKMPLTEEQDQWISEQLITFADHYDHLLNYLDSHAVRTFVREYIYSLSGICVKESGGLYFVKQEHAEEIAKLGQWVRSIGSEFHALPLLNLEDQRDMIMQAFEEEVSREVDSLMAEISKILQDSTRKIEEKTFDAYGLRAAELTQKMREYTMMLDGRAEHAAEKVSIYRQQILQLAGRIKSNQSL